MDPVENPPSPQAVLPLQYQVETLDSNSIGVIRAIGIVCVILGLVNCIGLFADLQSFFWDPTLSSGLFTISGWDENATAYLGIFSRVAYALLAILGVICFRSPKWGAKGTLIWAWFAISVSLAKSIVWIFVMKNDNSFGGYDLVSSVADDVIWLGFPILIILLLGGRALSRYNTLPK
jgi:hypothetical protein